MKTGGVTLSGAPREPSYRVRAGEAFEIADFESRGHPRESPPSRVEGGDPVPFKDSGFPLTTAGMTALVPTILFEDSSLLVIDKPAGLVVHPAPGHRVGTLLDWLKGHLGSTVTRVFTDPERLGLVHRLDKDTSGVLVIAKTIPAQTAISRQFRDRTVRKTYAAFIEGVIAARTGVIDAPVGRSRKIPTRMEVSPLGKASETAFEIQETLKEVSLVRLTPKTGRTHQIRVHLSAIGHPIVGDRSYGAKSIWGQSYGIRRPLLHAERLELAHPSSGKAVTFQAPWPEDFMAAHARFREAFRTLLVLTAAGSLWLAPVYAQDGPSKTSSAARPPASRNTGALTAEVKKIRNEVAALREELANIKASLEKLNVSDRLRDVERAAMELNAKAVSGATSGEETKTQVLDFNRKLKTQQDVIEQLRDQVDRLQQQAVKQQAAESPSSPSPASPGSPAPSGSSGPRPWGSRSQ
ncbi:MAG: hypothetical protein A2992_00865 [Elusimicrobia bacterium RIFCSPLOWO2_01_FULL_59_12]|nr:MAG: hypothetical protein A2992_00865 [Elusimicrobia bacterium RIFCSPLOWO2_01_FULL_59_12]